MAGRRPSLAARALEIGSDYLGMSTARDDEVSLLTNELQEATEDVGTMRREMRQLGYSSMNNLGHQPRELTPRARFNIVAKSWVAWAEDPQAGAAIDLRNAFVFGRGVPKPQANDDEVQGLVIDPTWKDPQNRRILTSHRALMEKGVDLGIQSNVFFLFFGLEVTDYDGRVRLGLAEHDTIVNAVRHPEERMRILYYKAHRRKTRWDWPKGEYVVDKQNSEVVYYEALDAFASDLDDAVDVSDLEDGGAGSPPPGKLAEGKLYHLSVNKGSEAIFGVPRFKRLLRWFNAYEQIMRTSVDLMKASASIYMKATTRGGKGQLMRASQQMTRRASPLTQLAVEEYGAGQEMMPTPPVAGPSVLYENAGIQHTPFSIDPHAKDSAAIAQQSRMQVSAGTGMPPWFCLGVDERVLTADLRWIRSGDLQVGDQLLAFDEEVEGETVGKYGYGRRWRWSEVTRSDSAQAPCVRVSLTDGTDVVCTENHPWLADVADGRGHGGLKREWVRADELGRARNVVRLLDTWDAPASYEAGWLAGMFDGEGTLRVNGHIELTICQLPGDVADRIFELLERHETQVTEGELHPTGTRVLGVGGGAPAVMRTLGSLRPQRLLKRWLAQDVSRYSTISRARDQRVGVASIERVGERPIQTVSTSTHTYIGEGFAHHNTGDASSGNLALATSVELPVLKMIEEEQETWEEFIRTFADLSIKRAIDTGLISETRPLTDKEKELVAAGHEPEGYDPSTKTVKRDLGYDFSLPNPLRRVMAELVAAVSTIAAEFDPNNQNVEMQRFLFGLVLEQAWDIKDPKRIVMEVYPPDYEAPAPPQPIHIGPDGKPLPNPADVQSEGADGKGHTAKNPYGAEQASTTPEKAAKEVSEAGPYTQLLFELQEAAAAAAQSDLPDPDDEDFQSEAASLLGATHRNMSELLAVAAAARGDTSEVDGSS